MSAQTSSYYLPFLLFANLCTVHGSIGEITFARLLSADKASVISFLAICSALYWTPIMFTVYMVHTRSTLYDDERAFDKKWYRWGNQYAFHEFMFRTQLMIILSIIVIFSFEPDWPFFTATSIIGMVFSMSFMSKCVSFLVEPRILSKDENKYFYQLELDEESERRQNMQESSECLQMKRQRSRIIKSRHQSVSQQFSWKKQQKKQTNQKLSRNIMSTIKMENSNQFELRTPLLLDSSSSSALELFTFTNDIN